MLLFLIYRTTLENLVARWDGEDFSYCYMIPFVVLYVLWGKWKVFEQKKSVRSWSGLIPLGLAMLLFFVGELAGEFTVLFFSCWLAVVGLCWLHMGWQKLKTISFPLLFSIAMFVPPNGLYAPLTLKLKLLSSQIGVKILQLYGLSAYREGNVIDLGFTQLQVVDACSGLRYVIPLFVMGVLMAYYYNASLWKRIVLVLSTIPLSIITNSLRIASVGILYQYMGSAAAEGLFHDFSGWFIFMVSLAVVLLEMWLLNKLFKKPELDVNAREGESVAVHVAAPTGQTAAPGHIHFVVAVALLGATLTITQTVNFREKIPPVKAFSGFPLQVGEWSGTRQVLEQRFLDELKLSDYAMVDYKNLQGKLVSFYVAYNESQGKGEATHSPATCLPSSGWIFRQSGSALVPCNSGSMVVSRVFTEKNGERQLVYFWFPPTRAYPD